MKRIPVLLMTLLLAAIMCACTDTGDTVRNTDTKPSVIKASDLSLNALLDSINDEAGISADSVKDLKRISSAGELDRYYMIAEDEIVQFAGERTGGTFDMTEIVIVEAVDEDTAEKLAIRLYSQLDAKQSNARSYTPETAQLLENSVAKCSGRFAYLVICEKQDAVVKLIENAIG